MPPQLYHHMALQGVCVVMYSIATRLQCFNLSLIQRQPYIIKHHEINNVMLLLTIFILIFIYSFKNLQFFINSVLFRRLSALSFIYSGILTFNALYIQSIGSGITLFNGFFEINFITTVTSLFILIFSSIIILIWPNTNVKYNNNINNLRQVAEEEYSIIIYFSVLGGLLLISSSDLLSLYLSIELQSFSLYILASLYKEKLTSTSAGLKYFLLGGLSSSLILLGSGLVYSYTGLTNLESIYNLLSIYFKQINTSDYNTDISPITNLVLDLDNYLINNNYEEINTVKNNLIAESSIPTGQVADSVYSYSYNSEVLYNDSLSDPNDKKFLQFSISPLNTEITNKSNILITDSLKGVIIGFLIIFSGFLFKIAASPFHNWSPDVYDDSPTIVTIWLTIMPKISILILLLELVIGFDLNVNLDNSYYLITADPDFISYLPEHLTFSPSVEEPAHSIHKIGAASAAVNESNIFNNINTLNLLVENKNQPTDMFNINKILMAEPANLINNLLLISSLLSLIIGSILGLNQIRIKRLLAYSTINHIGFLLLSLSVLSYSSIEAFIFYIFQYSITNLNVFLILLVLGHLINVNYFSVYNSLFNNFSSSAARSENQQNLLNNHGATENNNKEEVRGYIKVNDLKKKFSLILYDINYIKSLKGLFFKNPILSISLSISLFSFAGVPPLIGFFAKQQVLYSATSAGYYFISLVAILVSVISASYYLKIIKILSTPNNLPHYESELSIKDNNHGSVSNSTATQARSGSAEINDKNLLNTSNSLIKIYKINNVTCFLIGILTMSILLFIFNPEIILNTIALITGFIFNI